MTSGVMHTCIMPAKFRSLTFFSYSNEDSARKNLWFFETDIRSHFSYLRDLYVRDCVPTHDHCFCGERRPQRYITSVEKPLSVELAYRVLGNLRDDSLKTFQ